MYQMPMQLAAAQLLGPRNEGIQLTVYGDPQPQGSTRAFMRPGMKYPVVTSDNPKNKSWRQEVASQAINSMLGRAVFTGAIMLTVNFYFERPKSQKKAIYKTTRPDCDKLVRSIADAMTGIVYGDDSQIVQMIARKAFGSPARAEIQVAEIHPGL